MRRPLSIATTTFIAAVIVMAGPRAYGQSMGPSGSRTGAAVDTSGGLMLPAPPEPPQAASSPAPPVPPAAPDPPQAPKAAKPVTPPAPPTPPPSREATRTSLSSLNVRVDVTITDQSGSNPAVKKSVSVTVVDGGSGSVRSGVTVPIPNTVFSSTQEGKGPSPITSYQYKDMGLSLDVTNVTIIDNIVRLRVSVEYNPVDEKTPGVDGQAPATPASFAQFRQQLNLALQDGKPLLVAQSSDPVPSRNRTASLEVKATILK